MKLIEIEGLFKMDYGAPSPVVISNSHNLVVIFYADKNTASEIPVQRNDIDDKGVIVMRFNRCISYKFGGPSNETIFGHPYYKLGMMPASFYELINSDYILNLQEIDSVHPRHNSSKWKTYKHYILTFHDDMFECVAEGFEVAEENTSMYTQSQIIIRNLFN